MQKNIFIAFTLFGAFLVPFGQSSACSGKRDADGNMNCVNCTGCRNCTNCNACDKCTNCIRCSNQTDKSDLQCQGKKRSMGVGHMPYQVSLQRISAASKVPVHFCGGVIIRPNWILTSAHCFDSDKSANFSIIYGALHDKSGMTVMAERLILHPNYHLSTPGSDDDLALIRTTTPLQLNNDGLASPIQVATGEITRGMVTISVSIRPLCKIHGSLVPPATNYQKHLIHMICVANSSRDPSHSSYSGGAAVQNGQLMGLVCGGKVCGRSDGPGRYMSLAKHAPWIDDQIDIVEQKMKKESV